MEGMRLSEARTLSSDRLWRGEALKVELDRAALFALASDSRLEILKALKDERRTLSQLAELLGVDKAAVHRHLKKLEDGGLVKRSEEHGFLYYSLTWRSRGLISPEENAKIVVLLSLSVVLLVVCVALLSVANSGVPSVGELGSDSEAADSITLERVEKVQNVLYLVMAIIIIAASAVIALAVRSLRRPRQKNAERSEDWEVPMKEAPDIDSED
jgi:DNA-binding transcriptional ArsR family regulator